MRFDDDLVNYAFENPEDPSSQDDNMTRPPVFRIQKVVHNYQEA